MEKIIVRESSKNIRLIAYSALAGKWKIGVLSVIISWLMVFIPAFFIELYTVDNSSLQGLLMNLVTLLIGAPLELGVLMVFISLFRDIEVKAVNVINGFEYFIKAVALSFITTIFIILWTLLFIIPGIIAAIRYSQAMFILADDPSKDVFQCINESKDLMLGNKLKYFYLLASYIGWAILGALTFGLGYIILLPYLFMGQTAFYEIVTGRLKANSMEDNTYDN